MSFSRNPIRRFRELRASMGQEGFNALELVVSVAIMVALSVGLYVAINGMANSAREARAKAALEENWTPAPTATPSEVAAVSDPVSPPDLTVLWVGAGAVGAILVLAVLVALLVFVIRRNRRAELEILERQRLIDEDRNQALAVWKKSVDRHGELSAKTLEIETDWDMLFSYPTLADSSVPQTREFHRALRVADGLSSVAPAEINLSMDIAGLPYPRAVAEASEAWTAAWSFAKRTGTKLIPRAERKKVDQILKLLKLARDSGGSEFERSVAYGRVSKLISELQFVHIPARALQAIGAETRLMLEASTGVASTVPQISEPMELAR